MLHEWRFSMMAHLLVNEAADAKPNSSIQATNYGVSTEISSDRFYEKVWLSRGSSVASILELIPLSLLLLITSFVISSFTRLSTLFCFRCENLPPSQSKIPSLRLFLLICTFARELDWAQEARFLRNHASEQDVGCLSSALELKP